ncbi:hypothetical protein H2198_001268 [Neophaeococcomyces mojaviensis]|uniref:Uncharacterized protein n=1 Tax=Neophaeococcomyces mojaviensis TaxID=3383035 RepID=A0ACC3AHW5_9EURO|nr:hypothetical protein H2198_001268 [Knufia sp. JES_112]
MTAEDQPSIGFVCPLYTELKAVREIFDKILPSKTISGTNYFYGLIGNRKAVAVTLPYKEFGPIEASKCASKLVRVHPSLEEDGSYGFLVGIAGGIWSRDNDVRLGDVVIATRIWDWRSGKTTNQGFKSTKYPERAPEYLLRELGEFLYDRSQLATEVQSRVAQMQTRSMDKGWTYPGQEKDILYNVDYHHSGAATCEGCDHNMVQQRPRRSTDRPRIHDGLVASGNTVLKDPINREQLQQANALAVEMEACGMLENFVVIRGISDYADSHKNDMWQPYAAATAAACARMMIDMLVKNVEPTLWMPDPLVQKLDRHADAMAGASVSRGGSLLASASDDKTVRLWNPNMGREVQTLRGHTGRVFGVAFSPDGSLLASASDDKTVRLWNPKTGQKLRTLRGHTSLVFGVAFSPDGSLLASVSGDKTVRLWNPKTGHELRMLEGHTKWVSGLMFSPDGSLLASASDDKTVRLWNPKTGYEVQTLRGHTNTVLGVAFSSDGSLLASGSLDMTQDDVRSIHDLMENSENGDLKDFGKGYQNWLKTHQHSPKDPPANRSKPSISNQGDQYGPFIPHQGALSAITNKTGARPDPTGKHSLSGAV